jgi:hypothetical protein
MACKKYLVERIPERRGLQIGVEDSHGALSAEIVRLKQDKADLLAALRGMLDQFGNQRFNVRKDYHKMVDVEAARVAIARAEKK